VRRHTAASPLLRCHLAQHGGQLPAGTAVLCTDGVGLTLYHSYDNTIRNGTFSGGEGVVVPLECCNAPVALALPGVYRVLAVPGFKQRAVFVGEGRSAKHSQ
jgi:hypothetical protein